MSLECRWKGNRNLRLLNVLIVWLLCCWPSVIVNRHLLLVGCCSGGHLYCCGSLQKLPCLTSIAGDDGDGKDTYVPVCPLVGLKYCVGAVAAATNAVVVFIDLPFATNI